MKDIMKRLEDFLNLKHLLIVNVLFLLALKLVIPLSVSQFAIISGPVISFDSRDIIAETNKAREAEHLPPLKTDAKLDLAAQEKLQDMVKNSYFAHVSPSGVNPWFWISNTGYHYKYAGENLALGYSTASETVRAWLNSPGHRANLLNTNYEDIGVSISIASINGISGILVVQTFGNQLIAPIKPTIEPAVARPVPPKLAPVGSLVSGTSVEPAQEISTDKNVRLITKTESVKKPSPAVIGFSNNLTTGYVLYLSILMSTLMVVGVISGFKKTSLVTIGVSFALLILTVSLPAVELTLKAYIF